MKLEDRIRQSIRRRSGTVVLRSDVAPLGSQSQVTQALGALVREGELLPLRAGVYAKGKAAEGRVRPVGDLETIVVETAQKWGVALMGPMIREASGGTGDNEVLFTVEVDKPRMSRELVVDGQVVRFRGPRGKRRDGSVRRSMGMPTQGVDRYVRDLARRLNVAYVPSSLDRWADTVTRLAGDEVEADSTQDLLVALRRAGKLSQEEVAELTVNHLRERKHGVRSV